MKKVQYRKDHWDVLQTQSIDQTFRQTQGTMLFRQAYCVNVGIEKVDTAIAGCLIRYTLRHFFQHQKNASISLMKNEKNMLNFIE